MLKKYLALGFILIVASLMMVSVVYAQAAPDIDFQEIISNLGPRTGDLLILDILLYLIFGMGLITMLLVPDKQQVPSLIMLAVLGVAVIGKVEIFGPREFAIFVINVVMFVGPFMVAGMVRERGRRPRALLPAILTGLLGGGYFFLFWALRQQ